MKLTNANKRKDHQQSVEQNAQKVEQMTVSQLNADVIWEVINSMGCLQNV